MQRLRFVDFVALWLVVANFMVRYSADKEFDRQKEFCFKPPIVNFAFVSNILL